MAAVHGVQSCLLRLGQALVLAAKDLVRCKSCQAAVMMLMVVPLYIILTPAHGVVVAVKASWVVRLVFQGLELRFTHGVVVAHPESAVAGGYGQLTQ